MEKEVKDVIEKGISDINSKIDAQAKSVEELTAKVKTLEEKPVVKTVNFSVPEVYKGVRISKQLESQRHTFADQKMADQVSRLLIDVSKGVSLQKAAAVQVEGTDSKGGYLVLDAFDDMINKTARNASVMIPLLNNKTVSQTDTFSVPAQLANAAVAWDAEGTVTATSSTYQQTDIAIKRLSGYVSMSNELLSDSAYDIVGDISEQFAYAMAQEIDNQVLNGTGIPVSGVLTAAAGFSVVMATGLDNFSSVTAADYSLAMSKLATFDLNLATFVTGKLAMHYVRTLADTNGAPIYQSMANGSPDTIYGVPRVVANKITDTTGASTGFAVLGNFKQMYLINRLGAMDLLVDPYSDSVSNNTRFIWKTRKGLGLVRGSAFCRIITAA